MWNQITTKEGADMKKVYDVIQIPFGDAQNFKERIIATAKSEQLARSIIARCNTGWHTFRIAEREV